MQGVVGIALDTSRERAREGALARLSVVGGKSCRILPTPGTRIRSWEVSRVEEARRSSRESYDTIYHTRAYKNKTLSYTI